jgi:hypothetical protein
VSYGRSLRERQHEWAGVRDRFEEGAETDDDRHRVVNTLNAIASGDDPRDAFGLRVTPGAHAYCAPRINQATLAERLRALHALADRLVDRGETNKDRLWLTTVLAGMAAHGIDPRDALNLRPARGAKRSVAARANATHDLWMHAVGWMRGAMQPKDEDVSGHGFTFEKAAHETAKHFPFSEETIRTYCSRLTREYPDLLKGEFELRRK